MCQVRFISEREQREHHLLDIMECVDAVENMFRIMANHDYVMSGKNKNSHGNRLVFDRNEKDKNIFISMPAYLGGDYRCTGIKWHGPNVQGSSDTETKHILILNDSWTGAPIGILPANELTTFRTAAVSVYASKLFANKNSETVGIIGPGRINTIFLDGLLKVFDRIHTVKIKGRGSYRIEALLARIKNEYKQINNIQVVDTFEEAVRDADIVSIATGFEFERICDMPIIRETWIKHGAAILCPSFIKFSDDFIVHKARKTADNLKMYESYEEELGYPVYRGLSNLGNRYIDLIRDGRLTREDIIDIPDVVSGRKKPKECEQDIVIFSSGGMGIEDLAVGYHVLKKAEKKNIGTMLEW